MSRANYDIKGSRAIQRGFSWRFVFTRRQKNRQPVDLTGLSARFELRDSANPETPAIVFTSDEGKIVLGDATGTVEILLTAGDTAAIDFRHAARYRLIFSDNLGDPEVFLAGVAQIGNGWQ
ncbi:hypothetical protein AGMMS50256_37810 [Betaproteobacteria bacterium]|nr:hypothetical protein AGMMS50256_37810 [Betaproteobacteria bacterium]